MARSATKFYIRESSGLFIELDTSITDIALDNQVFYVEGNKGADSIYVGNNVTVDARVLGSGADRIYLQGAFADYNITFTDSGEYTFTGFNNERTEVVNVSATSVSGAKISFSDGYLSLYNLDLVNDSYEFVKPVALTGVDDLTPDFPLEGVETQGSTPSKVFIFDTEGGTVTPFKPGAQVIVQGGKGVDKVYVGDDTVVDASTLGSGADKVYLQGKFGDYSQSFTDSGSYTFTGSKNGRTDIVTVSASSVEGASLYFSDGHISLYNFDLVDENYEFVKVASSSLISGGTPLAGPVVQSIDATITTKKVILNLSEAVDGSPSVDEFIIRDGATSTSSNIAVASVALSSDGTQIQITLSDTVSQGDTLYLTYAKSGEATQLDNANGVVLSGFSAQKVNVLTDNVKPTITRVLAVDDSLVYSEGDAVELKVEFSEAVIVDTTGGTPRFALNIGTGTIVYANYVSGSESKALIFKYIVLAEHNSSDLAYDVNSKIELNGGTIKDFASNDVITTLPVSPNSLSAISDIVIDTKAPTFTANPSNPTADTVKISINAGTKLLTLTADESIAVSGTLAPSDFTVIVDGAVNTVESVALNEDGVTVELTLASTIVNDAEVTVSYLSSGGEFIDVAGNPVGSINNRTVKVFNDTTSAKVLKVYAESVDGTYATGDEILIKVQFSEAVKVTGTPTLALNLGNTSQLANYKTGTGSNELTFSYTVGTGVSSSDLNYKATSSLTLNGGTISDLAGNDALLGLPVLTSDNALSALSDLKIDGVAPTIDVDADAENASVKGGSSQIVLVASELLALSDLDLNDFTVSIGGNSSVIESAKISADQTSIKLVIADTVTNNATDVKVSYSGAGGNKPVTDVAGNLLVAFENKSVAVVADSTAPNIVSVSSTDDVYAVGDTIDITLTLSEDVVVTGTTPPSLILNFDNAQRSANYLSGSGSNELLFQYRVVSGDVAADLGYTTVDSLNLTAGASITDVAGNALIKTLPTPLTANSLSGTTDIAVDGIYPEFKSNTEALVSLSAESGTKFVKLIASETISFNGATNDSGFTVLVNGDAIAVSKSELLEDSKTVVLTLDSLIPNLATVTVAYNAASANAVVISDSASNAMTSFAAKNVKVLTDLPPSVVRVYGESSDGVYGIDDVVTIAVEFSESVEVSGTPILKLDLNGTSRNAEYSNGSGTDTLYFDYTVSITDVSSDLAYVVSNPLILNGGTIKDVSSKNATLTLPTIGSEDSLSFTSAIVIDGINPKVSPNTDSVTKVSANAGTKTIKLTASEEISSVDGPNASDFTVTMNGASNVVTDVAINGSVITLSVSDLILNNANITVNYTQSSSSGNQILDSVDNALQSFQSALDVKVINDTVAPSIDKFFSTTSDGYFSVGDEINISALVSESIASGDVVKVELNNSVKSVVDLSANGTNVLSGTYLIQQSDNVSNLSVSKIAANDSRDLVGNLLSTSLPDTQELSGLVLDTLKPQLIPTSPNVTDSNSNNIIDAGDVLSLDFTEIVADKDQFEESLIDLGVFGTNASYSWVDDSSLNITLGSGESVDSTKIVLPSFDDLAANTNDTAEFIPAL